MELAADLEGALGAHVPVDAVTESTTIRSLWLAIFAPRDRSRAFDLMLADAVLPADIQPIGRTAGRTFRSSEQPSLTTARHILLTGATGFLGSEILDRLMARTNARITCLTRSRRATPHNLARVAFVLGDLAQPRAGLSDDAWERLTASVDCICHAGASINWIGSYEALRSVNVLGTRELLRLACEADASFHFISSVSVCYSRLRRKAATARQACRPLVVDESFDPLTAIEGLHFGYAQTKAVAEALVREAAARGLCARTYRPAFISGDSRTGRFNPDDMLTALIAGSVRMGAAPDLDWRLDALPVDVVADLILGLSAAPATTLHLVHPRPRHWRECVLWMRLYGYDVALLPYREWTRRLREEATASDHPLRALRSFFLDEHEAGLTIPELHEETRRPGLEASRSAALISRLDVEVAPLDAALLDTYFDAYIREGKLRQPDRAGSKRPSLPQHVTTLGRGLLAHAGHDSSHVTVTRLAAGDSIISELTAWRSGSATGLFDVHAGRRRFVLKIKPHAEDAHAVGLALAGVCSRRLADEYDRHGRGLGLEGGHEREVWIYRDADAAAREYLPGVIATRADAASRTWAVLLEHISDATSLDTVDRPGEWTHDHIATAIDGVAALHTAWRPRVDELRRAPWIGHVRTVSSMERMIPLWRALAAHAAPLFTEWTDASLPALHRGLIGRIAEWRPLLEAIPQTLIHNDFNPRNVCLRNRNGHPTLCAFDWELATIGAPVRDLAEFLCFVFPPDVSCDLVDASIERHRCAFTASAGVAVDREAWRAGFGAALSELLVDRLSVYAMIHRVKPQRFLPRVLRTWRGLYAMTHQPESPA